MRKCTRCKTEKPPQDYYNPAACYCKSCARIIGAENFKKNRENDPDYLVKRRKREVELGNVCKNKWAAESSKKHLAKYPEKSKARNAVKSMSKTSGFDKHHWSYNNQHLKDIIEMPKTLHLRAHRFLKYDPATKMFHSYVGEFLDTKEKHKSFLDTIIKERILPLLAQ